MSDHSKRKYENQDEIKETLIIWDDFTSKIIPEKLSKMMKTIISMPTGFTENNFEWRFCIDTNSSDNTITSVEDILTKESIIICENENDFIDYCERKLSALSNSNVILISNNVLLTPILNKIDNVNITLITETKEQNNNRSSVLDYKKIFTFKKRTFQVVKRKNKIPVKYCPDFTGTMRSCNSSKCEFVHKCIRCFKISEVNKHPIVCESCKSFCWRSYWCNIGIKCVNKHTQFEIETFRNNKDKHGYPFEKMYKARPCTSQKKHDNYERENKDGCGYSHHGVKDTFCGLCGSSGKHFIYDCEILKEK